MPDKRDIHKAKSHRNSRNKSSQQKPATRGQTAPEATVTMTEPDEKPAKKNKSKR